MASNPQAAGEPRRSAEFVESSVLEAVVPAESDICLEDELASWDDSADDENGSVLPFLHQRPVLLFDEIVPVCVVFRTPLIDDTTLRAYISRVAINLEAFAFSTAPSPDPETKAPPPKELIYSGTIQNSNEPAFVRSEKDANPHVYVIWKVDVFICRPRGRFHKPAIYFQPSASLKPAEKAKKAVVEDEYLPSKVPTALNLLQSFENDPALAGVHPRLSALRVNKIAPTAPVAKELVRPIRTGLRRLFRAAPALVWRMRYSKPQSALRDMSLVASLDLEVSHITGYSVSIDDVQVHLRGGHVETMVGHGGASLVRKPGDQITYLYRLFPELGPDGTPVLHPDGYVLGLKMKAKALVSEHCLSRLSIEWRTGVDLSLEENANLIKEAHRVSNPTAQPAHAPTHPDALPTPEEHELQREENARPIHITLTISGPPHVVVGKEFHWDVFVVNRSDKTRKLALLILPKRKRDWIHKSQSSTSSVGTLGDKKNLVAPAVVDENMVYAKQKSGRMEPVELLCLTTDVRVGHLAPGACYTAHLRFLALSSGVLNVDALRIVDLATQDAADVRDLPSIVAVDKDG